MIDRIQSFGDSFVFGSDLSDSDNRTKHSQKTWPALVAKQLGHGYSCHAIPGSGNLSILHSVISFADSRSLNIINWSWQDRFDHDLKVGTNKTVRPSGSEDSGMFYRKFHGDQDDKFRSLIYMYSAFQYLEKNGFRFISTIMDKSTINDSWRKLSPAIDKLLPEVDKHTRFFPNNQTLLEWSRANGYPESEGWHPLELAHEKAAEYWLPIYEKEISKHITTK